MGKAQDIEVGLVDRVDQLLEPDRQVHEAVQERQVPGQRDESRERNIGERHRRRQTPVQEGSKPLSSTECAPCPEHEQELPGKGVEVPDTLWISRQIEIEP